MVVSIEEQEISHKRLKAYPLFETKVPIPIGKKSLHWPSHTLNSFGSPSLVMRGTGLAKAPVNPQLELGSYASPMTVFDPWDPYRDLRFAGTREYPGHGTCFIAEGRILVEDLLGAARAGHMKVISVAATTSAAREIRDHLPAGTELLTADSSALSELAGFPFHRGLMACARVPTPPPAASLREARHLLVLPRLYDSENLGLLLRSAAALGLDGVLAGPGPGQWTRRTVRVSMGAVWRIPVWRIEDPWGLLADWKAASARIRSYGRRTHSWSRGCPELASPDPQCPGDGPRGHRTG